MYIARFLYSELFRIGMEDIYKTFDILFLGLEDDEILDLIEKASDYLTKQL